MENESNLSIEVRIKVPWGHLAGRWYGEQQRRPILALHGWLDNCGTFATLAPLLIPHCSLLCIDLPGHGHSSNLPIGVIYSKDDYVSVVLLVMQTYNWEKISLLGHSLGGAIAFDFAVLYPNRVDMVLSIDTLRSIFVPMPELHYVYLSHVIDRAVIENERLASRSPKDEPASYSFEECEERLYEGSRQTIDFDKCKYILERNLTRSRLYPEKYYISHDSRIKAIYDYSPNSGITLHMAHRICSVQLPYLVIKAGESQQFNETLDDLIELLIKHNPNFKMHELAGERHHLHLNNPRPVAELIISFLRKHPQFNGELKKGTAKL